MHIKTGNMKNAAKFKLSQVSVRRVRDSDWSHVYYSLKLPLLPDDQSRSRFSGDSYGPRKHPATVEVELYEVQQMLSAFTDELEACHRVLLVEGLWDRVDETKKKIQEARLTKPATSSAQPK